MCHLCMLNIVYTYIHTNIKLYTYTRHLHGSYYGTSCSLFFHESCKDGYGCSVRVRNDGSSQYLINITDTSGRAMGSTVARERWRVGEEVK